RSLFLGLATALQQVLRAQIFGLFELRAALGRGQRLGLALQTFFFGLGVLLGQRRGLLDRRIGSRLDLGLRLGLDLGLGERGLRCRLIGLCLVRLFGFAGRALGGQLFLLAAQQLGLATGFFLAAGQLFGIDHRRSRCGLGRCHRLIVALDEGALLAHFHLDGASAPGGVGLLDLAGGFFHQRDLLALAAGLTMTGLEVRQQLLLVRFGN